MTGRQETSSSDGYGLVLPGVQSMHTRSLKALPPATVQRKQLILPQCWLCQEVEHHLSWVSDASKILVFASGFFLMRAFYSCAVGMETHFPTSFPVMGSSEAHDKRLLAKEAEAVEEEFNRSRPISVGHLRSQDTARSSSGPRLLNDAIPIIKPQPLVEANSIVEKEVKREEPLVDLSSPQNLAGPIENLSPGIAGLSSNMLRGRGHATKGVGHSRQRRSTPPHPPAAVLSLAQAAGGGGGGQGPGLFLGRSFHSQTLRISRRGFEPLIMTQRRQGCCGFSFKTRALLPKGRAAKNQRRSYSILDSEIEALKEEELRFLEEQGVVHMVKDLEKVKNIISNREDCPCPAFSSESEPDVKRAYHELGLAYPKKLLMKDRPVVCNLTLTGSEHVKERDLVAKNRLPSGKKPSRSKKMEDNREGSTHGLPARFGSPSDRPHLVLDSKPERKDSELLVGGCPLGRE